MTTTEMTVSEASDLVIGCFEQHGCSRTVAESVAKVIIAAEVDGCASHGLFRVPGYVASLKSGKVDGRAEPFVQKARQSAIMVNGKGGFAPPALELGRAALIEKAKESGMAALGLIDIYHFSALWTDLEAICREGLCAFGFTNYLPFVAPAGGTRPLFGTNPMAFGWPRKGNPPMIFDQASSVQARGEVMIAERDGHQVAEGVGIDMNGNPTTDPSEILKGAMLPFGGYKGSAIALMVELLAGAMIGEQFSFEAGETDNNDGGPPKGGELILAIDPVALAGAGAFDHAEKLFRKIADDPGARLPAERRYRNRDRTALGGLCVSAAAVKNIRALMG